ncbi:MAG TPA: phosphatase PAP2 family protein [Mycobacteriales bacterium]|nr:phosphatase PAP2 family protein [Mycobacteriales bacterium]
MRAGVQLAVRLAAASVIAVVLAMIVYLVFVRTALGQRFDNAVLLGSQEQSASSRSASASTLSRITKDSFAVVLVGIVIFGAVRRRIRLGIAAALGALIAVVGVDGLRRVILQRPFLIHTDTFGGNDNTFPSGHTATAIACALALVIVSPPAWRGICAVVAGSYAWLTAVQVQTATWHRPSDAIGAALLAFASVAMLAAVIALWRPIGIGRRFGDVPAFIVLAGIWIVTGIVSAVNAARVLHYLLAHDTALTPTPAVLDDAYHFSTNLTIMVVVTLLATLLLLLGPADLDEPVRQRQLQPEVEPQDSQT